MLAKSQKLDLPIYRAFKKYGLHNFTFDILESFIPDPEATTKQLIKILDELEVKYIAEYEAYTKGYNCTVGGDYGTLGLKMTQEQRKKMSEIAKKSATRLYKPVYLYNMKEKTTIYAISVTAAANIIKAHRSSLYQAAVGKYLSIHGHIVAFTLEELEDKKTKSPELLEKYSRNNDTIRRRKKKIRTGKAKYNVRQYDLNGNLLAVYKGMSSAAEAIDTDTASIQRVCDGRRKTCHGYVWKKELIQPDCKQAV